MGNIHVKRQIFAGTDPIDVVCSCVCVFASGAVIVRIS